MKESAGSGHGGAWGETGMGVGWSQAGVGERDKERMRVSVKVTGWESCRKAEGGSKIGVENEGPWCILGMRGSQVQDGQGHSVLWL